MTWTDWLTRAADGCPECKGSSTYGRCLCCEHTAAFGRAMWENALEAIHELPCFPALLPSEIVTLQQRGPDDAEGETTP